MQTTSALLFTFLVVVAATTTDVRRNVHISLQARWFAPTLLQQSSEYIAAEGGSDGSQQFWSLLCAASSSSVSASSASSRNETMSDEAALNWLAGGPHTHNCPGVPPLRPLDQMELGALRLALASRLYSPAVQARRHMGARYLVPAPGPFAVLQNKTYTSAESLVAALRAAISSDDNKHDDADIIAGWDHVYPTSCGLDHSVAVAGKKAASSSPPSSSSASSSLSSSPPRCVSVVVYGLLGSAPLSALHSAVLEVMQSSSSSSSPPTQSRVRYAFRHFGPIPVDGEEPQLIQGYGVELALKNMEYTAIDDKHIAPDDEQLLDDDGSAAVDQDVQGFFFGRLTSRFPSYREKLDEFRQLLLAAESNSTSNAVKVWLLQHIGLQAAQRVLSSADPLRTLRDISQNFVPVAPFLARMSVNSRLRDDVATLEAKFGVAPGANLVTLNGRLLDVATLSPLTLHGSISAELRVAKQLMLADLSAATARDLLLQPELFFRIDARTSAVTWLNDVEKDQAYWRWPSELSSINGPPPSPNHLLRSVRKNLYNVVAVVNPAKEGGLVSLFMLSQLWRQFYPIHLGVVLTSLDETDLAPPEPESGSGGDGDHDDADMASIFDSAIFDDLSALADARPVGRDAKKVKALRARARAEKEKGAGRRPSSTRRDLAELIIRGFQIIKNTRSAQDAWSFLEHLAQRMSMSGGADALQRSDVFQVFRQFGSNPSGLDTADREKQFEADIARANEFAHTRGVAGKLPCVFVNGRFSSGEGATFNTVPTMISDQEILQKAVLDKAIKDSNDPYRWLLHHGNTFPKFHALIMGTEEVFVDPEALAKNTIWKSFWYYHESPNAAKSFAQAHTRAVTHWIVADFTTVRGMRIAAEAFSRLEEDGGGDVRVALLHNPTDPERSSSTALVPRLLDVLSSLHAHSPDLVLCLARRMLALELVFPSLETSTNERMMDFMSFLRQLQNTQRYPQLDVSGVVRSLSESSSSAATTSHVDARLRAEREFVREILRLAPGEAAYVTNGRILALPDSAVPLTSADLKILETFELRARGSRVLAVLRQTSSVVSQLVTDREISDRVVLVAAILGTEASQGQQRKSFQTSDLSVSSRVLGAADARSSSLEFVAIVDPLSTGAQKIAPLVRSVLAFLPEIRVVLVMNPKLQISEMPLKNFYRYVVPDSLEFSPSGRQTDLTSGSHTAVFSALPALARKHLLTANLDVPATWLVAQIEARYDMDNLLLQDSADRTVVARYRLDHILITGRCMEEGYSIPTGLQLQLIDSANKTRHDTIVMQNLGYFQLQAAVPGPYSIALAPGRAAKIFSIVDNTNGVLPAVIDSFSGLSLNLKVARRPGMQREPILPPAESGGLWGSISSSLGLSGNSEAEREEEKANANTIHIFSLATGHLYERFLRIMIQSVIRQTKSRVKFWFLKNYLSAQFKEFLPYMARKLGFEFALVEYRWPSWLNPQTEKQRIIWGYKILFLDVMFPLNVKKIIYVDADQVVRADLAELWNMNLGNAPYAFTPFCNDRSETDGFRFWKQGFWMQHLHGKPYHISALFVVDLERFRQMGAGDHLRVIYDNLSKDPNSLANLDQDLPNYAQHQVPIFSLPQEWLWCETWCSDASKPRAKTIDLCNNPLTKTPKLENAKRILPEWIGLDQRANELQEQFYKDKDAGVWPPPRGDDSKPAVMRHDLGFHPDEL
eukprot:gnl/Spiro4/15440_TR8308_c0_g1_i1.p1 gnl/Spiro4/15440_TR8308_c0_g1~~gnl/Spiro4/15440_TR8308_c0_g1_i1.p1  ORF type:complete len:1692 (+),score=349.69 gnl/Spiro4/15440_TR8308_c0_g1_i1:48-5123(+)